MPRRRPSPQERPRDAERVPRPLGHSSRRSGKRPPPVRDGFPASDENEDDADAPVGARLERDGGAELDRERQHEAVVVVRVLADEVHAAGRPRACGVGVSVTGHSFDGGAAVGRGLGGNVADPGAHGGLRSGEVLELVGRAARARELQVQAHGVAADVHGA
jgi:hypothetical protein